jgi:hypothetical protein
MPELREETETIKTRPFLGMVLLLLIGFIVRLIDRQLGTALVASAVAWLLTTSAILHSRNK